MLKWINSSLNKTTTPEATKETSSLSFSFETDNLPGRILDLQFQCESEQASPELIAALASLYTQAVQYFQSNNDPKYRLYQRRLQFFLKKQNIDEILRGKSGQLVNKKDTAEKKISHACNKSKSEVNKLLNRSERVTHRNQELLASTLTQQEDQLNQRIQRRKAMSNRSSNTNDEDNEEGKQQIAKMDRNFILDGVTERKWQRMKKVFM